MHLNLPDLKLRARSVAIRTLVPRDLENFSGNESLRMRGAWVPDPFKNTYSEPMTTIIDGVGRSCIESAVRAALHSCTESTVPPSEKSE